MTDDGFRLFPEAASAHAHNVDALYGFLLLVSGAVVALIGLVILWFCIKYRRGNTRADRTVGGGGSHVLLEVVWSAVPLAVSLLIFAWGASLYFDASRPPAEALEIQTVGKQWMWKFQHPDGRREINTLHVPCGRPVRLTMISEDVIHSLFVPAFRIKHDVLPGSYSSCWFEATESGEFHLFCAEYCGTNHSRMRGKVVVLEPADYEAWLAGNTRDEAPADAGARLFAELRCNTCHVAGGAQGRCPPLENVFGHEVKLRDGATVRADEGYMRESILKPQAKIVAGFEPIMPAYETQLNEEQLLQLIAYIKSLAKPAAAAAAATATGMTP